MPFSTRRRELTTTTLQSNNFKTVQAMTTYFIGKHFEVNVTCTSTLRFHGNRFCQPSFAKFAIFLLIRLFSRSLPYTLFSISLSNLL